MASTAGGMARRQLRQFIPRTTVLATPTPSCSYRTASSSRAFSSSARAPSSWPAAASPTTDIKGKAKDTGPITIPAPPRAKTIADIHALKQSGVPIVCLTAYDYPTALSIRAAPIDLCLVGDSLANVALGHTSTQPLSLDAMIHHCQAVKRAIDAPLFSAPIPGIHLPPPPLVIADLPFVATLGSLDTVVAAVGTLIQQTGIDGVKIEGEHEAMPLIQHLTQRGIPVMGHVGLQPQRIASTSGYRVQGKTAADAKHVLDAARALQHAGCFSIVLECIPTRLGEHISSALTIPTIGIGAGNKTDGQILVMNDVLADLTSPGHVLAALAPAEAQTEQQHAVMAAASPLAPAPPKFVRNFCAPGSIGALRVAAVQAYADAVRRRTFPNDDEAYKIKSTEWAAFLQLAST
ncbi:ketopantoate hydroxymethyltransferase [Moesziomyces antarcticus T-34]|uniref:3-methyl-2-oxobutanoate hydroxymethyltransferase n=1 Tax=Pseudozyma antarctica (strain T-34) TaxID=1151754 RepID=M9MDH4_PSEA3|nr:ketopantoate hydroxymethyltransferase [Moesziomyces antarcticus T-34]